MSKILTPKVTIILESAGGGQLSSSQSSIIPKPVSPVTNRTSDSFWENSEFGNSTYEWNVDQWQLTEEVSSGVQVPMGLQPIGSWSTGFRPSQIRITHNTGPQGGSGLVGFDLFVYDTGGENVIGSLEGGTWDGFETPEVTLLNLNFASLDIGYIEFSTFVYTIGPVITLIEFL